jgi:predicted MFS family arabinose efflux permease
LSFWASSLARVVQVGLLAFTPGLTVLGLYKRFGMADAAMAVANDAFQSRVGGIAAVLSGLGKLFGGQVADRFGFRRGTIANTLLQVSVMLALPFTLQNRTAFAACVCGALFSLGGSISMYVTVNAQTFGVRNAGEIYSLLFSALALASVFGAKLTAALLPSIGWGGVFRLLAAMGVVNLGMLALLKRETAKPAAWDL